MMDKVMSWREIKETFNGEWVLIEDPELAPTLDVVAGRVIFHGQDRVEAYRKSEGLAPEKTTVRFAGGLPAGWDMIL